MTDKNTVVDAVSVYNPQNEQNLPFGIDPAQVQKALKDALAKATAGGTPAPAVSADDEKAERINPSIFIRDMSMEMERLYGRFETLKLLASEINGMTTDESFPPQVAIKGLTLDFAISKDGKTTDHSVKMQTISCIGDVSNIMANEFGFIIASLRELSRQVADLAQKTNERCVAAFQEWESVNKNKQVVAADEQTPSASPTATPVN